MQNVYVLSNVMIYCNIHKIIGLVIVHNYLPFDRTSSKHIFPWLHVSIHSNDECGYWSIT